MKAFAFVLLCALAAVQGRYTALQSTRSAAALGENPWVVHLRIAVSTSGLLETCAGSLIGSRWVLTAASCVTSSRFIWVRYGVVNVINPSQVIETSLAARLNPGYNPATGDNNVALIGINRDVQPTDNIGFVNLVGLGGDTLSVCAFGGPDGPGEVLNCYKVKATEEEDGPPSVSGGGYEPSKYDLGAAVVSGDVQVGILADESGRFQATAGYVSWIEQETGLVLNPETVPEATPEPEDTPDPDYTPEPEATPDPDYSPEAVHFV